MTLKKAKAAFCATMFVLVTAIAAAPYALLNASPAQYNPISSAQQVVNPSVNQAYTTGTWQPEVESPNGALRVDNNSQNNYLFYTSSVSASVGGYGVVGTTITATTSASAGIGLTYAIATGFQNGALLLKTTPGFIAGVTVSSVCSSGGLLNFYDTNTATTNAPEVASVNCNSLQNDNDLNLATSSGLYVTFSGTPGTSMGITVSWR